VSGTEVVAQVKAHMVPTGRPDIQNLRGAAHDGRAAVFFSLTGYTAGATEYAAAADVALFRFADYSGSITPINDAARRLLLKVLSAEQAAAHRRSILDSHLKRMSEIGWEVEERSDYVAVIVSRQGLGEYPFGCLVTVLSGGLTLV